MDAGPLLLLQGSIQREAGLVQRGSITPELPVTQKKVPRPDLETIKTGKCRLSPVSADRSPEGDRSQIASS